MDRITPVHEVIQGINLGGLTPLEAIAEGRIPQYTYETRSRYGLVAHAGAIRYTLLKKGVQVKQLKNQVLVDLGAGAHADGFRMAQDAGAGAYVGVEPHFASELYARLSELASINPGLAILASVVNDDMLTFLRRLPPDSVSVLTAGIDDFVIQDLGYMHNVGKEIARVLHPKGAYICDQDRVKPIGDPRIRQIGESLLGIPSRNIGVYVKGN